jgi:predicted permease
MMLGRRPQEDFEAEIRAHLQLEVDRLQAEGMSAEEAERVARRNFGNTGIAGDRFHDGRRLAWFDDGLRDAKHAFRSLLRSPTFFVTSVATLALAIGAVAAMFSVVNTVLLKPLPFANQDRLVFLQGTAPGSDLPERFDLGYDFYMQYKENSKLIDGIFVFSGGTSTFRAGDRVERIPMAWPTNDMYATLGVKPQLGRLPRDEEGDDVVVISDELWATWFGRDPNIIGKSYFVSDSTKRIVGVMPKDFKFPSDRTMLWISGVARAENINPGEWGPPVVARMKPGVTTDQLAAELTRLAKSMPERFGGPPGYAKLIGQYRSQVTSVLEQMVGPTLRASLWVLLGGVSIVLLIACANIANLFLVRAESRRRDSTVRRAIGASRAQLIRYQMTESFVVALVAGVLAIALSAVSLPLFVRAAPDGIPRLPEVALDLRTVGTSFAIVILVAFACGIGPALRSSAPDLTALRDGGRGTTGRRQWGRDMLVVAQTSLALVLLIGAALLVQSFERLRHVDPGYDTKDIYTFQFAPDQPNLRDGPSLGRMHLGFMERLRGLPGVTAVGVVNNLPLDESTPAVPVRSDATPPGSDAATININFTGGDYFNAIGIKVLAGRVFNTQEAVSPNRSVIISKTAADKLFPGVNATGRIVRPRFGNQDTLAFTVVGVVADVKQNDWREASQAVMYLPLTGPTPDAWGMGSPAYVVKSPRAASLTKEVRSLVKQIAPEAPVYREFTMEFLARRSMLQLSFTMLTLGVVSALALILGAVGLYGVLSYVVSQRTREIGVRMALGATKAAVRRQVVTQGARIVLVGVVIGVICAVLSTRLLATLLFDVRAVDPMVFGLMSAIMIGMGVLASYMPARRASSLDPIEALRND